MLAVGVPWNRSAPASPTNWSTAQIDDLGLELRVNERRGRVLFFPVFSMTNIILPRPRPLISHVRQSEASPASAAPDGDRQIKTKATRGPVVTPVRPPPEAAPQASPRQAFGLSVRRSTVFRPLWSPRHGREADRLVCGALPRRTSCRRTSCCPEVCQLRPRSSVLPDRTRRRCLQ